jgi:hypothetical protein
MNETPRTVRLRYDLDIQIRNDEALGNDIGQLLEVRNGARKCWGFCNNLKPTSNPELQLNQQCPSTSMGPQSPGVPTIKRQDPLYFSESRNFRHQEVLLSIRPHNHFVLRFQDAAHATP